MPEIHVTLLGRFAVTVDGVPVAEAVPKLHKAAHFATRGLADRQVGHGHATCEMAGVVPEMATMIVLGLMCCADVATLRTAPSPDLPRAAGTGKDS